MRSIAEFRKEDLSCIESGEHKNVLERRKRDIPLLRHEREERHKKGYVPLFDLYSITVDVGRFSTCRIVSLCRVLAMNNERRLERGSTKGSGGKRQRTLSSP